jgi:hypothetical protein
MEKIGWAINNTDEFTSKRTPPQMKAELLYNVHQKLYGDSPYRELAKFDFTKLGYPEDLADGAAMEYVVDSINWQKEILARSTQALEHVSSAYQSGDRHEIGAAIRQLNGVLQNYKVSSPQHVATIERGLDRMMQDDSWSPDSVTPDY